MNIQSICLATGLALAFAAPAAGQGSDVAYCHALAAKYQEYLGYGSGGLHGGADTQNVDVRMAVDKCDMGDTSDIPILERTLKDAKIELPKHG
jgi:hypothetical protein